MSTDKCSALSGSDSPENADGFLDTERATSAFPTHDPETRPLDTEFEAEVFDLTRNRSGIPGNVLGVDTGRPSAACIHNAFWIPGKVPSLNDLLKAKSGVAPVIRSIIMRQLPKKGKQRGARFDLYNDIKQDWKQRTVAAIGSPFIRVHAAYFGYLVVEETLKRDPSNICSAAVKFIEDGLIEAGVIPNDGWENVLGIRVKWVHRKGREPGVYVVMSDVLLSEERLLFEYEDHYMGADAVP